MSDLVLNRELKAFNVFEFDIDYEKAVELIKTQIEQINQADLMHPTEDSLHLKDWSLPMYAFIPRWNGDISWVSAASKESFAFFDECYRELEVERKTRDAAHLDFPLQLYSGYFVVRSYGEASHFHHDYTAECGVRAFTMMTPIQIDDGTETGHLLYKDVFQVERKYRYRKGKAITFGGNFIHSTEPFRSKQKFIFLCFAYGTKDMAVWGDIKKTAARQGISYRHPDGSIRLNDPAFEPYF